MARSDEQAAVRRLAVRDVTRILDGINWFDEPTAIRDRLFRLLPPLINQYGDVAATLAAEHFESVIGLRAVLAEPVPDERIATSTVVALSPLFRKSQDIPAAIGQVTAVVDYLTLGQGDLTTRSSVANWDISWRWVPYGKTCDFCLLKASRGAVAASDGIVSRGRHDNCDCVAEPVKQ